MRSYIGLVVLLCGCGSISTTSTGIPVTGHYLGTATITDDGCGENVCGTSDNIDVTISQQGSGLVATSGEGVQSVVTQEGSEYQWSGTENNVAIGSCTNTLVTDIDILPTTTGFTGTVTVNVSGTCTNGTSGACVCGYSATATRQ